MCQDDGFASGWQVITSVRRFQHRLEAFMDQSFEPLGVSLARYRALESIDVNREMHIAELARFLRLSRQATHMAVRKLDEGGLVDLTPEAGRICVRPSELGLHRLRHFRGFTHDFKARLEEQLSDGERAAHPAPPKGGLRFGNPSSARVVALAVMSEVG